MTQKQQDFLQLINVANPGKHLQIFEENGKVVEDFKLKEDATASSERSFLRTSNIDCGIGEIVIRSTGNLLLDQLCQALEAAIISNNPLFVLRVLERIGEKM